MSEAGPAASLTLQLPEKITPELEAILGKMCFEFIRIAQCFRAAGVTIKQSAEAEQAFCLHWLLKLYAEHGDKWREAASAELSRMREAALSAATGQAAYHDGDASRGGE